MLVQLIKTTKETTMSKKEPKQHNSTLKQYMSKTQRDALGKLPTTHQNCIDATGVARPGKTARDRAKMRRIEEM